MAQPPKKSARDLSDLKAKLGMKKGGAAPGAVAPPPGMQQPPVPGAPVPPPGAVVPPPGAAAPYGAPQQPAQAMPEARRDPFAAQMPMAQAQPQVITDAGPLVDIPEEKKSPLKLIIALVVVAVLTLSFGWAGGRIYASRKLFNSTIEDAGRIRDQVQKLRKVNEKVLSAFADSRKRTDNKVAYDDQLVEDLKDIVRSSALANPEKARKEQDKLFRTNYAMMEDIAINRLFTYYNDTVRLFSHLEEFLQQTTRSKELIESYSKESASQKDRKYGVVFAEDAGNYYLGQLVEVGNIVCADENAKECRKDQIKGFQIRSGMTGSWSPRIGKPTDRKEKITDIVIPIIPDKNWKSVAVGKRGYLAFQEYKRGYLTCSAIAALLDRQVKTLLDDLNKAAAREKLFLPI